MPPITREAAGSRFALRNWKIRTRFVAVVSVPLALALFFGVARIDGYVGNAQAFKRVENLAQLNGLLPTEAAGVGGTPRATITTAVTSLQAERIAAAGYLVTRSPANLATFKQDSKTTDALIGTAAQPTSLLGQLNALGGGYTQSMADALNKLRGTLGTVPALQNKVITPTADAGDVTTQYTSVIAALTNVQGLIANETTDDALSADVKSVSSLSQATEQASSDQAAFYAAISQGEFNQSEAQQLLLSSQLATQQLNSFESQAPTALAQLFSQKVPQTSLSAIENIEKAVLALPARSNGETRVVGITPASYLGVAGQLDNGLNTVLTTLSQQLINDATNAHETTVRNAIDDSVVIIMALVLALIATSLVGRSLVRRIGSLRTSALEAAERNLPTAIADVEAADGNLAEVHLPSLTIATTDEIGELSRSFDQVQGEALRLAAEQAQLRATVNAMFVNLARRSQSLVERQLRVIDELEQSEQDPDQLHSLFRLDHLATRMRRNGENLLVLAGQESERRWSRPVPLVDLLRAATSEVEQYERIVLQSVTNVDLAGRAVNDIVHLIAELLENATLFSAPETEVAVRSQPMTGGVLLEVADQGIGMTQGELQEANDRLAQPPAVDVSVSRRMGLFVVSRLAHRHGIRVQLRRSVGGGITAFVMFPQEIVEQHQSQDSDAGSAPAGRLVDTGQHPAYAGAGVRGRFSESGAYPAYGADAEEAAISGGPHATGMDVYADDRTTGAFATTGGGGDGTRPTAETTGSHRAWGAAQAFAGAAAAHGRTRPAETSGSLFTPQQRSQPEPGQDDDTSVLPRATYGAPGAERADTPSGLRTGGLQTGGQPGRPDPAAANQAGGYEAGPMDQTAGRPPFVGRQPSGPASVPPPGQPARGTGAAPLPKRQVSRRRNSEVGAPPEPAREQPAPAARAPQAQDAPMQPPAEMPAPTRQQGPPLPVRNRSRMAESGRPGGAPAPARQEPAQAGPAGGTANWPQPAAQHPAPAGADANILDPATPVAPAAAGERLPIFEAVESEWFRRRTGRPGRAADEPGESARPAPEGGPLAAGPAALTSELPVAPWGQGGRSADASRWQSEQAPEEDAGQQPVPSDGAALPRRAPGGTRRTPAPVPPGREAPNGTSPEGGTAWSSPGDEGWRAAEAVRTPSANGITAAGLPIRVPKAHLVPGTAGAAPAVPQPAPPAGGDSTGPMKRSPDAIRSRLSNFQRGTQQGRQAGRQASGAAPQEPTPLRPMTQNNREEHA